MKVFMKNKPILFTLTAGLFFLSLGLMFYGLVTSQWWSGLGLVMAMNFAVVGAGLMGAAEQEQMAQEQGLPKAA